MKIVITAILLPLPLRAEVIIVLGHNPSVLCIVFNPPAVAVTLVLEQAVTRVSVVPGSRG